MSAPSTCFASEFRIGTDFRVPSKAGRTGASKGSPADTLGDAGHLTACRAVRACTLRPDKGTQHLNCGLILRTGRELVDAYSDSSIAEEAAGLPSVPAVWHCVALLPYRKHCAAIGSDEFARKVTTCDDVPWLCQRLLICWLKVRFLPGSPTFAHACKPSA